ncbi:MAG: TIGR02147 family protein [Fibrobacterales bacterium]
MKLPDIFNYYNYRHYLRDYYSERKKVDSKFSYRFFARIAGYNSSGLYKNIVEGVNNLTPNYIPKFVKALKLSVSQSNYFELIVAYTHETDSSERELIFKKMMQLQPAGTKQLKKDQMKFFSKWHHIAVHQALSVLDFKDDIKELARFVNPPIRSAEARASITLLKKLELIIEDAQGFWRPSDISMMGAAEVGVQAIHDYQGLMMDQGKEALKNVPREERHIITQTVAATDHALMRIKKKIMVVQEEIINIVHEEAEVRNKDRVFQLNIQFFPMSDKNEKGTHEDTDG